jgi:hypothetical protein
MAARDKKLPVVIDLENNDSVALIPWEYVVDKMDHVLGEHVNPDISAINDDLTRMKLRVKHWVDEGGGGGGGGGGGSAVLIDKVVTENGVYNARNDGADGYRTFTVNVPSSSSEIPVYETDTVYMKYQTVVDSDSDITYLVTPAEGDSYRSVDIPTDIEAGNLKATSDSRIVIFYHAPSQNELDALPENVLVVVYDPDDAPYAGIVLSNNG